ncbi:MAG: ribonuclease PH, partial [Gammaproteobacteria bacterium]|nr:ribonuclease PH [Gammaproteobacteria bacterium]
SLRAAVNMEALGENLITVDCDVIQADGGTRTASITGAYVALADAIQHMLDQKLIKKNPLIGQVAAISVGVYKGTPVTDLDYPEDCDCETDMNIVMNDKGGFIEIQGTAEGAAFSGDELQAMLALSREAINQLFEHQRKALE